ncbi:transmembrane ascorbate-dependent reductase CYB561-like [Eupeodes corollae]|uniref:transmembrane ascorbate-dependent reductase CYB561-like n=1 Tax=Eupeodes corollae TaxID=290404 RepID=UPI0024912180|nr:transmembrane ascorbate-dependent reductase CYB561-like [Eupeodes corollae]
MKNKKKNPLIWGWIIFIISEFVAAIMIYCLYQFHIDEKGWIQQKSLYQTHAIGMPISLIVINGHGMVVFRLLPGFKTRTIKYIHGLIHTIVIVLFFYLCCVIYTFKEKTGHSVMRLGDFHVHQAYLTMGSYLLQWFSACFVFVYMYSNQKRRRAFSAWHNFFGVCILQVSIATSCCMLQWEEHHSRESNQSLNGAVASVMMVLYGILINVLILNPFLEWPLIGPL